MEKMSQINEYIEYGKKYYGPFVYSFLEWVKSYSEAAGLDKLYFLARDSFCFFQCAQIIEMDSILPIQYIKVSKKSLTLPLLGIGMNEEAIVKLFFTNRMMSTQEFLCALGLDEQEITNVYNKLELVDVVWERDKDVFNLIEIVKFVSAEYCDIISDQLELIRQYLEQSRFSGKVGLVDVGWRGSCQAALEKLVSYFKLDVEIHGLYIGITVNFNNPISNAHGYLFENQKNRNYYQILAAVAIIEMLGMELCGTVLRYQSKEKQVIPCLKDFEYYDKSNNTEVYEVQRITDVQTGAKQFVEAVHMGEVQLQVQYLNDFLFQLSHPTKRELKLFGDWRCSNQVLRDVICFSAEINYFFNIKRLKLDLNLSYWKAGFLYKVFKNSYLSYLIYVVLKKIFK